MWMKHASKIEHYNDVPVLWSPTINLIKRNISCQIINEGKKKTMNPEPLPLLDRIWGGYNVCQGFVNICSIAGGVSPHFLPQ